MNEYLLKNKWVLWYHSLKNKSWDNKSYIKVIEIKSLLDYKLLEDVMRINHLQNGMFFLMKNDIFPTWEDPKNRMGGCVSFKYDKNILNEFLRIILLCVTGNLSTEDNLNEINGISISPKKEFNIIKIWFSESIEYKNIFIEDKGSEVILTNSLYKKHVV